MIFRHARKKIAADSDCLGFAEMGRTPRLPNSSSVFAKRLYALIVEHYDGSKVKASKYLGIDATYLSRLVLRTHKAEAKTVAKICNRLDDSLIALDLIEGYLVDQLREIEGDLRPRGHLRPGRLISIKCLKARR